MRSQPYDVGVLLMMGAFVGCGNPQKDAAPTGGQDSGSTSPDGGDTSDSTGGDDTDSPEEEAEPSGSTIGDLQPIDHAFASNVMAENLAAHIDEALSASPESLTCSLRTRASASARWQQKKTALSSTTLRISTICSVDSSA